ncbi:3-ketoacyl-ACP reductase [Marivirga lumbricoides]|uniref:3-ketoacyl-ACP reductase n=1 Tax=Marivirga lumbricoides TaxID=1046115 RepID=A0ABQ1MFB7_9BACT|nr:3-ketoacyl-ACP reductase [Marivirga lumbricoides]
MNILVSGANGNLGSAVVEHLTNQGKNIWALYGKEEATKNDNPSIKKHVVDLMEAEAAESTVKNMKEEMQIIHAAVLTVGGFAMGDISNTSTKDIHHQISLNFDTAYHLVQPLLRNMEKGGTIFLIGAKPALNTDELKGKLAYGLSKKMVFTLAEVINADTEKHGISCSVIVPDIIDTPPNRESMPKMDFTKWVKPKEIAETINFYLDNSYLRQNIIKAYGSLKS